MKASEKHPGAYLNNKLLMLFWMQLFKPNNNVNYRLLQTRKNRVNFNKEQKEKLKVHMYLSMPSILVILNGTAAAGMGSRMVTIVDTIVDDNRLHLRYEIGFPSTKAIVSIFLYY